MVRDDEQQAGRWGVGAHPLLTAASSLTTALAAAHGAIDAGSDPSWLAPADQGELLTSLGRAQASLDALLMRTLTACSGADSIAADTACRSAADWLGGEQHTRANRLHAATTLGTALTRWPRLAAALAAGEIITDHARAAVEALDRLPRTGDDALDPDTLSRAELVMLGHCGEFTPPQIRTLGARLLEAVAPDVAERLEAKRLADEERRARRETTFSMSRTGRGTRRFRGEIPELHASILDNALRALTNPRRSHLDGGIPFDEGPWGETAQDGDPVHDGRRLTDSQRLGQAFCTLIENLATDRLPTHGGSPVTVVVTITEETLRQEATEHGYTGYGTTTGGAPVSVGEAIRLGCLHGVRGWVVSGDGETLHLGRTRRLHTGPQRLALELQHPTCQARGCDVPAAWCETHHRHAWAEGGHTSVDDGALLCPHHHHRTHDPKYETRWHPDDTATFHRRC
ncbi:HNH endonuclease signature motif containing protein [Nocardioides sp. CFH 31398]|uniref:HNH endonuclease signature motif containing protein n=1 Tax=Nocardioides sp. CFH 31398 TaxID=2919579 RepID=UPI001F05DF9E|nr:HNH endonuclease signature motif containing protein [Nocardioides sp. CFH 31398]MCH1866390.1 HNH endonuclease [Nocardioides sp. CFH 31398]